VEPRDEHPDRGLGRRRVEPARDDELIDVSVELELDAAGGIRRIQDSGDHVVERGRLARADEDVQHGGPGAGAEEAAVPNRDEQLVRVGDVEEPNVGVEGGDADDRRGRRQSDRLGVRGGRRERADHQNGGTQNGEDPETAGPRQNVAPLRVYIPDGPVKGL
jgi:hypothetical protein